MRRLGVWAHGRFWLLPAVCGVLAAAAGVGLPELDGVLLHSRSLPFLFGARKAPAPCSRP